MIATGHNTPQLAISAPFGDDATQGVTRASLLRHPSRRKGLIFLHSTPATPVTPESLAGALDSGDEDDSAFETSSEDFDTTIRPETARFGQETHAVEQATRIMMRDTTHPTSSLDSSLSNKKAHFGDSIPPKATFPWPLMGKEATNRSRSPLTGGQDSSSSVSWQAGSIAEKPPYLQTQLSTSSLPLGHTLRRKPVPKLEDYDKLFPPRPQPRIVNKGWFNLMSHASFRHTNTFPARCVSSGHTPLVLGASSPLPHSLPTEIRPITPSSETERDTMRPKSKPPRFSAARLRESSPLHKVLLPFSRSSRHTVSTPTSRNTSKSLVLPEVNSTRPVLGSPIILSPVATISERVHIPSSPTQTPSAAFPYDLRYLSPASINSNDSRFSPTSSVPILPLPPTPGTTPDVSPRFGDSHTTHTLGPVTPSNSGSVPSTPFHRCLVAFDTENPCNQLTSGTSSRYSTPMHAAVSALSLRSIADKVKTLPSTLMRRTSSSQTVTQIAYTISQTRSVSPCPSPTAKQIPNTLRSPWTSDSEPCGMSSPDSSPRGESSKEMSQSHSVSISRDSYRTASPLPPLFVSQPCSIGNFFSSSSDPHSPCSQVESIFPPPLSAAPISSNWSSTEATAASAPCEGDGYIRGRSRPDLQIEGVPLGLNVDRTPRVRSRSEGASIRASKRTGSKISLKHKGSFRSFLDLIKKIPAKEELSPSGGSVGSHASSADIPLPPTPVGKAGGLISGPDGRNWAGNTSHSLGNCPARLDVLTKPPDLTINCNTVQNLPNFYSGGREKQLETNIMRTSHFIELVCQSLFCFLLLT